MVAKNHYRVLGVPEDASEEEITRAFRGLAKIYHPDVNEGDFASVRRFREIREAYEILRDGKKRANYDATSRKQQATQQRPVQQGPARKRPTRKSSPGARPDESKSSVPQPPPSAEQRADYWVKLLFRPANPGSSRGPEPLQVFILLILVSGFIAFLWSYMTAAFIPADKTFRPVDGIVYSVACVIWALAAFLFRHFISERRPWDVFSMMFGIAFLIFASIWFGWTFDEESWSDAGILILLVFSFLGLSEWVGFLGVIARRHRFLYDNLNL